MAVWRGDAPDVAVKKIVTVCEAAPMWRNRGLFDIFA